MQDWYKTQLANEETGFLLQNKREEKLISCRCGHGGTRSEIGGRVTRNRVFFSMRATACSRRAKYTLLLENGDYR